MNIRPSAISPGVGAALERQACDRGLEAGLGLARLARSVGPGPMALTRMRGASDWARVRVAVQSVDFDSV